MPVIKTEYVLAQQVKNMNWKGEKFDIMYLEERYAGERTGYLEKAFRSTSLMHAQSRLADLKKDGYATGFKVMALKTSLTTVK